MLSPRRRLGRKGAVEARRTRRRDLTDRLSLANALADADIERQKAERIATDPRRA
jgi:hypothetical protein